MTTLLYTHPACAAHDPGPYHPERPDRLKAIEAALDEKSFPGLERRPAPRADIAQIARVHPMGHIEAIFDNIPKAGRVNLDLDTAVSAASGEAALRAAGGACAAVDAVLSGQADNAFCAVRPPGHHAERNRAMGFCLFNNVAIAAFHSRAVHGLKRVAVVDFDVHHGNGTEDAFAADASLFYASSHQFPCYPGTGSQSGRGQGNIVNAPLAPGSGSAEFRRAYTDNILPALRDFAPELVLVSAGFDAHALDPLAQLNLATGDFAWVTKELLKVAGECCSRRLVSALEGGYDLEALAQSAAAHVTALMET